jgi:uncharacterized repeat protein (TIGR03803 family)
VLPGACWSATFRVLHASGAATYGPLLPIGSRLYGAGASIFGIDTDGSNFQTVHTFKPGEGFDVRGGLAADGSSLFGATYSGGAHSDGTIFSVGTDGSAYSTLYSFAGRGDGSAPGTVSAVVDGAGSTTAILGGAFFDDASTGTLGTGDLFSLTTSTSAFSVIHPFAPAAYATGSSPYGPLAQIGSDFFGATVYGGSQKTFQEGNGVIYELTPNAAGGYDYHVLHVFDDTHDGRWPRGGLIAAGGELFGLSPSGGAGGGGTLYRMDPDGGNFTVLHSFGSLPNEGIAPDGALAVIGPTLYGTCDDTVNFGADGTVFQINTDGSGYATLHTFAGADGRQPYGGVVAVGDTLYGTTLSTGTIYAVDVPEPAGSGAVVSLALAVVSQRRRRVHRP